MRYKSKFHKFYTSKVWKQTREEIVLKQGLHCNLCKKIIKGYCNVDHIIPLDETNIDNPEISLSADNLQLLCIHCHTLKTMGKTINDKKYKYQGYNIFKNNRKKNGDINLF